MTKNFIKAIPFVLLFAFLSSCKAFMHGFTWSKAQNSYYLVTGDKHNFGDRRLNYNEHFHKHSALSNFLDRRIPNFIYEYQTDIKCRGIRLYYVQVDSVFIFEEPKKGNLHSVLKEARKMDDYELQTYQRLKSGKS